MEDSTLEQLKKINSDIKAKNLSPFYFIYGEEQFFITNIEQSIKKNFIDNTSLNTKTYTDDNFDLDEVLKYISNMPFMNEKKLIIFKNIDIFKKKMNNKVASSEKKDDADLLIEAFDKSSDINIVLIIMNETDRKYETEYSSNNKFINYISARGTTFNSKKLNEADLSRYIATYIKKRNVEIDKLNAAYIITRCGRNLQNLINEVEKILAYIGDKSKIEKADIDGIVERNIEDNVFKLMEMINTGRKNDAFILYGELMAEKNEPHALLSLFTNNYKDMMVIKDLLEQSKSIKEISEITKYPDWRIKNIINSSKAITKDMIAKKLELITKYSLDNMKGDIEPSIMLELLFY